MSVNWCSVCGTNHPRQGRCPGVLETTGPEMRGWRVTAETSDGLVGYGVLVAETGDRWRSRILTFPKTLWTIPGGAASMKFVGRDESEARRKAVDYIRQHCAQRGFVMHDEIVPVEHDPFTSTRPARATLPETGQPNSDRVPRRLPVRFGRERPTVPAYTANMSPYGLFVATEQPLSEGEIVGLMLELEHMKVPLRASVIWNEPIRSPAALRVWGCGC